MTDWAIRVVVDPSSAAAGNEAVRSQLRRTEGTAQRLERTLRRTFAAIGITLLGGAGIRQVVELADEMTNLEGRLRLVTSGTANLGATQDELRRLALETSSAYASVATLYSRTALATQNLDLAQGDLLKVVKAVNQTIQLSGASATEASSSAIQFAQALASGTLQGDELRSTLENNAVLTKALADGLSEDAEVMAMLGGALPTEDLEVTIGMLRGLGEQGALTTERVIRAMLKMSGKIETEFNQNVPDTVGRGLERLQTDFAFFVDKVNKEFKITEGTAGLLDEVREFVNFLEANVDGAGDFVEGLKLQFDILNDQVDFSGVIEGLLDIITTYNALSLTMEAFGTDTEAIIDGLAQEFPALSGQISKAFIDPIGFIIEAFQMLPANVIASIRILTFEILAKFDELVADLLEAANDLDDFLGFDLISDSFVKNSRDQALAGQIALIKLREEEFKGLEDIRTKILETTAAREAERAAALKAREDERRRINQGVGTSVLVPQATGGLADDVLEHVLALSQELALLQIKNIDLRERTAAVMEIEADLGRVLTENEREIVNGLLTRLQLEERLSALRQDLVGPEEEALQRIRDLNALAQEGLDVERARIEAQIQLAQIRADNAATFETAFGAEIQTQVAEAQLSFVELGQTIGEIFGPRGALVSGIADATARAIVFGDNFKDSLKQIGQEILVSLISNLIKVGIQQVLLAALGKGLMTAALATTAAVATATASAWATPAALASLASFGANSAPAAAAITGTISLAQALAAIPGFASGGLVTGPGTGTSDSVMAQLSNGEYVVNAEQTRRFLPLLEAVNNGTISNGSPTSSSSGRKIGTVNLNNQITIEGGSNVSPEVLAGEIEERMGAFLEQQTQVGGILEGVRN